MYPSFLQAGNVSRETKVGSILQISSPHKDTVPRLPKMDDLEYAAYQNSIVINDIFAHVSSPTENAVYLGNKHFNLPSYTEMEGLISATP